MKKMRREDRLVTRAETEEVLYAGEYGVLSSVDPDGQPYGVPLSYIYQDDAVFFHSATSGHKLDNITGNARVSFCVVGKTDLLPDKFTTEYESAVVFGTTCEALGEERYEALIGLLEKYSADHIDAGKAYIDQKDRFTKVFKIRIDHISGKARR
jgi:nitroimidazol reductase NimA-like FMN-containing flavoprotein (pyridoxamine 5'-phosphate oxidase superfamily)